eukprot:ctg_302.g130
MGSDSVRLGISSNTRISSRGTCGTENDGGEASGALEEECEGGEAGARRGEWKWAGDGRSADVRRCGVPETLGGCRGHGSKRREAGRDMPPAERPFLGRHVLDETTKPSHPLHGSVRSQTSAVLTSVPPWSEALPSGVPPPCTAHAHTPRRATRGRDDRTEYGLTRTVPSTDRHCRARLRTPASYPSARGALHALPRLMNSLLRLIGKDTAKFVVGARCPPQKRWRRDHGVHLRQQARRALPGRETAVGTQRAAAVEDGAPPGHSQVPRRVRIAIGQRRRHDLPGHRGCGAAATPFAYRAASAHPRCPALGSVRGGACAAFHPPGDALRPRAPIAGHRVRHAGRRLEAGRAGVAHRAAPSGSAPERPFVADGSVSAAGGTRGHWQALQSAPVHALDAWAFGCLLYEVFSGGKYAAPEELQNTAPLPKVLVPLYQRFLAADASRRAPVSILCDDEQLLAVPFLKMNLFLENLPLRESWERESFLKRLAAQLDTLPDAFCVHKAMPLLCQQLDLGIGGSVAVELVFRLAERVTAPEELRTRLVIPHIAQWLTGNDLTVRARVLQSMERVLGCADRDTVNQRLFPALCVNMTGAAASTSGNGVLGAFGSSSTPASATASTASLPPPPQLRDLAVQVATAMAPSLTERNLNSVLMGQLAKLQVDQEPAIRTNTTVCLGKLAHLLNTATRRKILVPAFSRALKDPFGPARCAGLQAFEATAALYSAEEVTQRVLPAVCTALSDADIEVRGHAFRVLEALVARLREQHERDVRAAEAERRIGAVSHVTAVSSGQGRPGTTATPPSVSSASVSASASWSFASLASTLVDSMAGSQREAAAKARARGTSADGIGNAPLEMMHSGASGERVSAGDTAAPVRMAPRVPSGNSAALWETALQEELQSSRESGRTAAVPMRTNPMDEDEEEDAWEEAVPTTHQTPLNTHGSQPERPRTATASTATAEDDWSRLLTAAATAASNPASGTDTRRRNAAARLGATRRRPSLSSCSARCPPCTTQSATRSWCAAPTATPLCRPACAPPASAADWAPAVPVRGWRRGRPDRPCHSRPGPQRSAAACPASSGWSRGCEQSCAR